MGRLLLVRHGQASFGADDYDALSELGHEQARVLGESFARRGIRPELVLSGSLRRHEGTVAGILDGLGEAIRRLILYAEAGADLLFADALLSREQIAAVAKALTKPLCVNMGFGLRTRSTTPLLSAAELQACYQACDLFVLPSGGEGFGIVFLEAFAFARPVVAADAGGAPFVVRPGENGWLVPCGDPARLAACLNERLSQPEETRRAGWVSRRLVEEEFSFQAAIRRTSMLLGS